MIDTLLSSDERALLQETFRTAVRMEELLDEVRRLAGELQGVADLLDSNPKRRMRRALLRESRRLNQELRKINPEAERLQAEYCTLAEKAKPVLHRFGLTEPILGDIDRLLNEARPEESHAVQD